MFSYLGVTIILLPGVVRIYLADLFQAIQATRGSLAQRFQVDHILLAIFHQVYSIWSEKRMKITNYER